MHTGFDDLAPVSRRGVNWLYARATLVDALDSLYVVGLREDYERAVTEALRPTLVGEPPSGSRSPFSSTTSASWAGYWARSRCPAIDACSTRRATPPTAC